ncbi:MAG: radical SAM protein [bacterium]|nr:radical SAM protein [bacterium]
MKAIRTDMGGETRMKESQRFSSIFKKLWQGDKPIVKLFRTEYGGYLYDPGTNKILGCGDVEYKLVENLISKDIDQAVEEVLSETTEEQFSEAAQKLVDAVEKEKILLTKSEGISFVTKHYGHLEELCNDSLGQLILETTESCNLRCGYCIYNQFVPESRGHGTRHMELSTAFAAIDYLAVHGSHNEDIAVTFYGGEPLLRFSFIQSCVDYARKVNKGKKVRFSITTNATLITPEIAAYLAKEKFGVNVSIDGPQEIHDSYRVDTEGKGTFSRAIKGLKLLVDALGDRAKAMMQLRMVYAPPFSEGKLNAIAGMWDEYPWLEGIVPSITYPHPGSVPPEISAEPGAFAEDLSMMDWAHDKYIADYKDKKESHPLIKGMIVQALVRVFKRPIYIDSMKEIYLNGCCLPAVRKIFVSVQGDIHLCERVNTDAPVLGNVKTGIDYERMKRIYIREYGEKSLDDCSKCWGQRLCGSCYLDGYSGHEFDLKKKRGRCRAHLYSAKKGLELYTTLLKIDPEGLNYISDIDFS